jgi:hypothetical protein
MYLCINNCRRPRSSSRAARRTCAAIGLLLLVAGCDSAPFSARGSCATAAGITFLTEAETGGGSTQIDCAVLEAHAAKAKQLLVPDYVTEPQWPAIAPTPVYIRSEPGRFYFEDGYYWGVTSWHGWILVERSDESLVHELLHRHELVNHRISSDVSSKHQNWIERGYYQVAGIFGDWVRSPASGD